LRFRSVLREAARDIDQVRAAAAEQRMAHGRDICTLEGEMGRVGKAIEAIGRLLGQQKGEWQAAISDLHKRATQEWSKVSRMNEVLANFEGKHKKLREIIARQGDELVETCRWNSELGGRVWWPEEENRLLRKSSERLKGELDRSRWGSKG
jgi:hypothetical protein